MHVIPPFPETPENWVIDRAFDWGSSKPFAVLYFAESDGQTPVVHQERDWFFPKGSLFVIGEIYGWNGKPNQGSRLSNEAIARLIKEAEKRFPWGNRVRTGPADDSIFANSTTGQSIATDMSQVGVRWRKANRYPGSRVNSAARGALPVFLRGGRPGDPNYFNASARSAESRRCGHRGGGSLLGRLALSGSNNPTQANDTAAHLGDMMKTEEELGKIFKLRVIPYKAHEARAVSYRASERTLDGVTGLVMRKTPSLKTSRRTKTGKR